MPQPTKTRKKPSAEQRAEKKRHMDNHVNNESQPTASANETLQDLLYGPTPPAPQLPSPSQLGFGSRLSDETQNNTMIDSLHHLQTVTQPHVQAHLSLAARLTGESLLALHQGAMSGLDKRREKEHAEELQSLHQYYQQELETALEAQRQRYRRALRMFSYQKYLFRFFFANLCIDNSCVQRWKRKRKEQREEEAKRAFNGEATTFP
jgi:hypothetical protein